MRPQEGSDQEAGSASEGVPDESSSPAGEAPEGRVADAASDAAPDAAPGGEGAEGNGAEGVHEGVHSLEQLEERLSRAEAERDAFLDDLRRLKAEFENFRKRSQRELAEARDRARSSVILEFLPIMDNLERALAAATEHEEAKLIDGVRMTHKVFLDLLKREGVERVSPLGAPFDPELHEALMAQSSEEPEGIVIHVLEPGYVQGDRLLRAAKVVVSRGSEGEEG